MMTKGQCLRVQGRSVWEVSHQLPRLPCRGVRPDKEQEVRGDSSQSIADKMFLQTHSMLCNSTNSRADSRGKIVKKLNFTSVSGKSPGFNDACSKAGMHY